MLLGLGEPVAPVTPRRWPQELEPGSANCTTPLNRLETCRVDP